MNNISNTTSSNGKMSKIYYSILGMAIFALVVGHFTMQMSFIGGEDKSLDEALSEVQVLLEDTPNPQIDETENTVAENIVETTKVTRQLNDSDVVLTPKRAEKQKVVVPIKVVQKEIFNRPVNVPKSVPVKEKISPEVKSERLRQAEKLLTGF